ncbi:MAG: glutathionylspermidine synthase, partial [Paenibacillaceae bacterium]|nr:glutathionylspermidine synthase [Paenibacillaceae bacterium]
MGVFEIVGVPHADRNARVAELNALGFSWANIGEEQYWIDQLVTIPMSLWQEIDYAASGLWAAFDKAARFVIGRRELYEQLSIPELLWDGLDSLEPGQFGRMSRYARFDFAVSQSGEIRLLELNADTPTGYVEAAIVTPWLCEQHGVASPNSAMADQVRQAWAEERPDYAACIAYGEHLEDSGTIEALVRHSGREMRCVDCLDLWVDEGVLRTSEGAAIDRLFALY